MRSAVVRASAAAALLASGGVAGWATAAKGPRLHDTIGRGEAISLRVRGGETRARALMKSLWLRRLSDGDEVPVTCAPGRPLFGTGHQPFVVVPYALAEALIARGTAPQNASMRAERMIHRAERTGRTRALERLRGYDAPIPRARPVFANESGGDYSLPVVGPGSTDEQRARRARIDALRTQPHPEGGSALEQLSFRRVLLRKDPRGIVVLPHLPQYASDARALASDALYELRSKGSRGFPIRTAISSMGARVPLQRDALRLRVHPDAFPYDLDREDFAPRQATTLSVLTTMPPNGEADVPIDRAWSNPLSLGHPEGEVSSPRFDVWLSAPIEPVDLRKYVSLRIRKAGVGTPDERSVWLYEPHRVSIEQSHLGDVRLTVRPARGVLEPSCRYTVELRDIRRLGSNFGISDRVYSFTTEALTRPDTFVTVEFDGSAADHGDYPVWWYYPEWRDTALLPAGEGVTTADPDLPTSVALTGWFDSGRAVPRFEAVTEENAEGGQEYTRITPGVTGTDVQVQARTAPQAIEQIDGPDLALATPFTPIDEIRDISDRGWVQFRVVFTVAEGLPDGAEMPSVDRIVIRVSDD